METGAKIRKVMLLLHFLMIMTVFSACEPVEYDPNRRGGSHYVNTCAGQDVEPYVYEPLGCDDYYIEYYDYSEEYEGTCCDWEVSFDGYEKYCYWVESCGWEYDKYYYYQ